MILSFLVAGAALAAPAAPVVDVWVRPRDTEDHRTLRSLGMGFVESEEDGWWRFHGEPGVESQLARAGIPFRHSQVRLLSDDDGHRSPSEMNTAMETIAATYPAAAELVDIGTSVEGRPIIGLRLSPTDAPHTRMRILGAHHGDETASAEVAIDAASRLLDDPDLSVLDYAEVWVIPHVNPDGIAMLQRYNANSVDLNRNYGFEWSSSSFRPGDDRFYETQAQAIRALSAWVDFGLGLSMHSGAVNLGWVWNYTTDRSPDEALLSDLANVYAEDCTTDGFWTTNGADWYITNGDTTDWAYGRYGTLDYTLEVSLNKHPDEALMADVLDEHLDAVPAILAWPWWASGWVSDTETGLPVQATVTLLGSEQRIVSGPDGHFSRPVGESLWAIEVSAPGYESTWLDIEPWAPPVEIGLSPSPLSPIQPLSRVLRSDGSFQLDSEAEDVLLSRPGHPEIVAEADDTAWRVDLERLNPGPWTLVIDGLPSPNAVFVPERSDAAEIESVTFDDEFIEIEIAGLGRGARVWRLDGPRRNFSRIDVNTDLENKTLRLPADALSDRSADFLIRTRGTQIALLGLDSTEPEDEPEPEDTGSSEDDSEDNSELPDSWEEPAEESDPVDDEGGLKAGGCQVVPTDYPHLIWLVSLIGLVSRRRSQCAPHHCSSPFLSD